MSDEMTVERASARELLVKRIVNGPPRAVFEAWTRPQLVERWWAPRSMGKKLVTCEMDVRVGGTYRFGFGPDAGDPRPVEFFGRYLEVVPPSRLVWTSDEGEDGIAITTATFEERGGETLLVLHDLYPSKEILDGVVARMKDTMREMLEQLNELVVTLGYSGRGLPKK